jgi:hypothetical protein
MIHWQKRVAAPQREKHGKYFCKTRVKKERKNEERKREQQLVAKQHFEYRS